MKALLLFLRIPVFLIFVIAFMPEFCGKALAQPDTAEWTIMVYMDGDNNLEHAALMDLLEMEQSIPENVHVLVLLDRHKGYSNAFGDWTGTRLYRVRRAAPFDMRQAATGMPAALPQNLASELLEDWGEADMADPATLTRFIEAAARFPARRYALVPWNHGSGASINGMLSDEDGGRGRPGKGSMSIGQFVEAAWKGADALPQKRFDLIKYELCLMGQLDVMAESARIADFAFASPPEEPAQGSDYLSILPLFRADISTEDLVRRMVDINVKYYTELGRPAAFSAYKLAHMKEVTDALKQLTDQLRGLAGARFKELTRATCFATHYENLLEDLGRGQRAMSSVELSDWLDRLEREVPGVSADTLSRLREASRRLVYHAGTTPNLPECKGVTLYLPLRREYEHSAYRSSAFARESGLANYLSALYTAQDTLGDSKPRITNVVLGTPRLKPGRDGSSGADFDILPISHLTPFYRNVIRFDVTGTGILLTKLMQFDQRGTERRVYFEQLVTDNSDRKDSSGGSLFSEISPRYNDGTTTIMRELSVRYKVSNGSSLGDITITNVSPSRDFAQNVSIGYGLYRDSTTGGQDVMVQVQFSNRMRIPLKMIAYQTDAQGRTISMRGMMPRSDGVFRPAVTVLDAQFKGRRVFGPPMPLSSGVFLLTVDMIDDGAMVGDIVAAETMSGAKAYAVSPVLPVRHNQEQVTLRENARQNGLGNLFGKYAMIELASFRKDPVLALPTFQTVEFHNTQPNFSFTVRKEGKTSGSGLLNWMPLGLPQISLHKKSSLPGIPLGETIQTWYAFLKGQGQDRVWYCIGMGDGTRWALVPMEQYQEQFLEGVWTSKTERWEFKGNTVQLTRDGHTGRGTFRLKEHILSATNMPADEYAVYLDREHGHLTLITRRGVASILTREGMAQAPAAPQPTQTVQTAPAANPAQALAGQWISGPETGYARLSVTPVQGTSFFNMRLISQGQGETVCTFAVSGDQLLATFRDNSRAVIRYALINNSLTLFFPNMPEIRFTRQ